MVKYNADIDRFIKIKLEVPPYLYFYFTLKLIAKMKLRILRLTYTNYKKFV